MPAGKNVPPTIRKQLAGHGAQFVVENFQIADLVYRATNVALQESGYLGAKTEVS
jgi:hypothetical protein